MELKCLEILWRGIYISSRGSENQRANILVVFSS